MAAPWHTQVVKECRVAHTTAQQRGDRPGASGFASLSILWCGMIACDAASAAGPRLVAQRCRRPRRARRCRVAGLAGAGGAAGVGGRGRRRRPRHRRAARQREAGRGARRGRLRRAVRQARQRGHRRSAQLGRACAPPASSAYDRCMRHCSRLPQLFQQEPCGCTGHRQH